MGQRAFLTKAPLQLFFIAFSLVSAIFLIDLYFSLNGSLAIINSGVFLVGFWFLNKNKITILFLLTTLYMAIGFNFYSSTANITELAINYGLGLVAVTASSILVINKQNNEVAYIERHYHDHRHKCIVLAILKSSLISIFIVAMAFTLISHSSPVIKDITPTHQAISGANIYFLSFLNNTTLIVILFLIAIMTKQLIRISQLQSNQIKKINHEKKCYKLSDSSKSKFIASMTHELKTPLNSILGFNQMLKSDLAQKSLTEQLEYANDIETSGRHLKAVIDKTLDFCKAESHQICIHSEEMFIEDELNICLLLVKTPASQKNITIEANLSQLPASRIFADKTRFRQALLNFLSNAIKYNTDNGTVYLDYQLTDRKTIRFLISDSGPGIPKNQQDKIFTPFNRLNFESSSIKGTGLGLSTTKELVELMGGKVGFQSKEGEGSTFWFELPLTDKPQ